MCVSCDCGKPNDNHGDPRHITMSQVEAAAQAIGKQPHEVASNIQKAVRQFSAAGSSERGQSSAGKSTGQSSQRGSGKTSAGGSEQIEEYRGGHILGQDDGDEQVPAPDREGVAGKGHRR